jgi:hypothetical protein
MLLALRNSTCSFVFFSRLHHHEIIDFYLQFSEKAKLLRGASLIELIIFMRVPH